MSTTHILKADYGDYMEMLAGGTYGFVWTSPHDIQPDRVMTVEEVLQAETPSHIIWLGSAKRSAAWTDVERLRDRWLEQMALGLREQAKTDSGSTRA